MDEVSWNKILESVKPVSVSVASLLTSAKPISFEGDNLKLGVYYKFHKDKLEESKTKKMLEEIALSILGREIRIECTLTEVPQTVQLTDVRNENIIRVAEQMFS